MQATQSQRFNQVNGCPNRRPPQPLALADLGLSALREFWHQKSAPFSPSASLNQNDSLASPKEPHESPNPKPSTSSSSSSGVNGQQAEQENNKLCSDCAELVIEKQNEQDSTSEGGVRTSKPAALAGGHKAALSRARFALVKSYTIAYAGQSRRTRSLVEDARLDTRRNKDIAEALGEALGTINFNEEEEEEEEEEEVSSSNRQLNKSKRVNQPDEANQTSFPRHISQLDQCNHLLIKYEPELDPTHPGFHDAEYRARRQQVAEIAFAYKHGEPIPSVAYSQKEHETWGQIYRRLKEAYAKFACQQHNKALGELESHGLYGPDRIPQLQEVSEFLERRTGWRLRPVAGLLSARDFLASLAFRVFQTTQYIRHWANPEHSVEPDCIHELMGHIPMLCDESFAQFSHEIGLASLGASDEQIEKFATLYWFTVEFGLCREGGQLKCYGAGLLSSYGEMEHALESGQPTLKDFEPETTALESYDDANYQVTYYVAKSFDEAKAKVRQYADRHLSRDFELAYDAYSASVRPLDSLAALATYSSRLQVDLCRLNAAIGKLNAADATASPAGRSVS